MQPRGRLPRVPRLPPRELERTQPNEEASFHGHSSLEFRVCIWNRGKAVSKNCGGAQVVKRITLRPASHHSPGRWILCASNRSLPALCEFVKIHIIATRWHHTASAMITSATAQASAFVVGRRHGYGFRVVDVDCVCLPCEQAFGFCGTYSTVKFQPGIQ